MPNAIGTYFELWRDDWLCARAENLTDVYSYLLCVYPSSGCLPNLRATEIRPCILWEGADLPAMGFIRPEPVEKPPLHL